MRAAAVGLLAISCTSADGEAREPVEPTGAAAAFCDRWSATVGSGDDERVTNVLDDPPEEIAPQARLVVEAEAAGPLSPEAPQAANDVLIWIELNCDPAAATLGAGVEDRRIAPPLDATPAGYRFCSFGLPSQPAPSAEDTLVIYGDTTLDDPYAGEMLGLVWGEATENSGAERYGGDGDRTPVTVRGVDAVAAPITVFQQTILPELGTVIAWEEDGYRVALYGRGFDLSRIAELAGYADALVRDGRGFALPDTALPLGFAPVYSGTSDPLGLVISPDTTYELTYWGPRVGEVLTVSGQHLSEDEFEAVRFFAAGLEPTDLDGRDALAGNALTADGPAVVTWRTDDGLAVRLVGLNVEMDVVEQTARSSRQLDRAEWTDLVQARSACDLLS